MVEYESGTSKNRAIILLNYSDKTAVSTDKYARAGEVLTSSTKGVPMLKAGSLVSISVIYDISSYAASGNFRIYAKIDDSNTINTSRGIDSDGTFTDSAEAVAGAHTFGQGQLIQAYIDKVSGTYSWNDAIILIEVEYND